MIVWKAHKPFYSPTKEISQPCHLQRLQIQKSLRNKSITMYSLHKSIQRKGKIILASTSPRRKEILSQNFDISVDNGRLLVLKSNFEETLEKTTFKSPQGYIAATAKGKALDVYDQLANGLESANLDFKSYSMILSADTVIVVESPEGSYEILEKPKNLSDHKEMLLKLVNSHLNRKKVKVVSSVCTLYPSSISKEGYVTKSVTDETELIFDESVSQEQIEEFIRSGEGSDACGGFKIQSIHCGFFIKGINGDYFNIVGLPLNSTFKILTKTFQEIS